MQELLVDFITSLDSCASGEGWPGWWGLEGPEYLAWLEEDTPDGDYKLLMGAKTYRLMYGFSSEPPDQADTEEIDSLAELTNTPKVVFSSSLEAPLSWANSELVSGDAVDVDSPQMRWVIDQIGWKYGWTKGHAPGEWWHVDYVGG